MDKKQKKEPGIKEWAIILAAGVLLLLLSVPDLFRKEKEEPVNAGSAAVQTETPKEEYAERMERKLEGERNSYSEYLFLSIAYLSLKAKIFLEPVATF